MRNVYKSITFLFLFVCLNSAFANTLTLDQKLSDFYQLTNTIKASYGPLKFKETQGIYIDEQINKYLEKIKKTKTNGEFYYQIVEFVASFKDSHFVASVPTMHRAVLGFNTDLVEGKVLIDSIEREILPKEKFPFKKGDEIISFNGRPISDVRSELIKYIAGGSKEHRERMSAMYITIRPGRKVPVPKLESKVQLSIRRGTSTIIEDVEIPWVHAGRPLDEFDNKNLMNNKPFPIDELSVKDIWKNLYGDQMEISYFCSGGTRVAIPPNAIFIKKKPFVAYYHKTDKGNIGYLRIPHYNPIDPKTGERDTELRFEQYAYAVQELEKNTVGLIIDQDHNCGGSITYLQKLVSLFIDKPVAPMQFTFRGTKENFLKFDRYASSLDSETLTAQAVKKVADLIKVSWESGEFLTAKTSFLGTDLIYPFNGVRYTKPIVMLIDENSGSGGDAFPALMQGYGRVTLLGTRTMGAGGHVEEVASLINSGIQVHMTKSLFYRPDGVAVENNGAVPNIPYTITRDDFIYQYKNYQKFYLNALFELIE